MDDKVRVSILALLAPGLSYADIQSFIREHLGQDSDREYRRIYGKADADDGRHRLQIKYSRVIDAKRVDEAGLLHIANAFRDAGYGDVAWKLTPIAPEDTDPEKTTSSFPVELFQDYLEEDERPGDDILPEIPPEPFGSDAFWKWFDKEED
jgi:hypothetical protein